MEQQKPWPRPGDGATVSSVDDRQHRIVSDMNSTYLSAQALADIERLGVELVEGGPLTVCDYDGDDDTPTWLVVEGVAHFDPERRAWQISYTMDDCSWEPRRS
jgi:hypothetical protein